MDVGDIEVGLTALDCARLVRAVRWQRSELRQLGLLKQLERFDRLALEIEAAAALLTSASGHIPQQYSPNSRSALSASGRRQPETLAQQGKSSCVGAQQAADLLGITARQVRRLAAAKQLRSARKVGRDWVVDVAEVVAMTKEA